MSKFTVAYFKQKSKPFLWAVCPDVDGTLLPNRDDWVHHHDVEIDLEAVKRNPNDDYHKWAVAFAEGRYYLLSEEPK